MNKLRFLLMVIVVSFLSCSAAYAQRASQSDRTQLIVAGFFNDVVNGFKKGYNSNTSARKRGERKETISLDARCQTFLQWTGRLEQEYPNVKFDWIRYDELTSYFPRLFDDTHFVAYFGLPYDRMDEKTLADVGRDTIAACKQSPAYGKSITWQYQLLKAFPINSMYMSDSSPGSYSIIIPRVQEIRRARAELQSLKDGTMATPLNSTSFSKLAALQDRILPLLWPSEQDSVNELFQKAKSEAVVLALSEIVDQAISRSQGYTGLVTLRQLPFEQREMFGLAEKGYAAQQTQRLKSAQDRVLSELMADEAPRAIQFPNTPAGLKDGISWYQAFENNYLNFPEYRNHPAVEEVNRRFWEKRNTAIAASEQSIDHLMRSATTVKQVHETYNAYLPLDGDQKLAVTQQIIKHRDALADKLLQVLVTKDRSILDAMPVSIERLKAESIWYQDFSHRYSFNLDSPVVKSLNDYFWQRRIAFINANQRMVSDWISTAQDEKQLNDFWQSYCLKGDDKIDFIGKLQNLAMNRRMRLELKKVLAHKQVDYLTSPNGEPSEAEMYDEISSRLSRNIKYFSKDGCDEVRGQRTFRCRFSLATYIDNQGVMNTVEGVIDKTPSGWIVVSDWSGRNKVRSDPTGPMKEWQQQLQKDADHNVGCMAPTGLKPFGCP